MFYSYFRWILRSRWRTLACLGIVTSIALLVGFWTEFCFWRAEVNAIHRRHAIAAKWVERSQWVYQKVDSRICLLQLRIARRRGDFKQVESKLQQADQLGAKRSDVQRERWLAMAQTNQFNTMQEHWTELLNDPRDDGPEIARAYYTWAMLRHDLGLARKTLDLWHQDYPQDAEPLFLIGRFYQSQESWEGAEDGYRRALGLAPDNDEYRLSLANTLQVLLKTKEAVPIFQDYLRRHPTDVAAVRGLAQCSASNGDLDSALRLLEGAIQTNPDDFETQKVYGETLLAAGDAVAAVKILEKAHRTVPEHANLAYVLARGLKACDRAKEAEPLFAFVAESRPQLDLLLDLEKKLRKQPQNLELRMKIAFITAKFVSCRDAIRWYENLLQIAPTYAPAHQALANLYRQMGDEKLADSHAEFASQTSHTTGLPSSSDSPTAASSESR